MHGKGKDPVNGSCSLQATCVSKIPVRVSSESTKLSFILWGGGGCLRGLRMMMACGVGDEDDGDDGDDGDCGDGDCDDGAHHVPGSLLNDHITQSSPTT